MDNLGALLGEQSAVAINTACGVAMVDRENERSVFATCFGSVFAMGHIYRSVYVR